MSKAIQARLANGITVWIQPDAQETYQGDPFDKCFVSKERPEAVHGLEFVEFPPDPTPVLRQMPQPRPAIARLTDPATSHEGAARLSLETIALSQKLVMQALAKGVATSGELIGRITSMNTGGDRLCGRTPSPSRVRTAVKELRDIGMVSEVGQGTTGRGNRCLMWGLTNQGRAFLHA